MDRLETPSGLPLFTAKEFTDLAIKKNVPSELAVIQGFTAIVEPEDAKAAPQDQKRFNFKISTDAVDRDKDIISLDGWDLDSYKKNPVVLFAHDYRSLPVGKSSSVTAGKKSLDATVEFAAQDVYPFAETVRRMVQAGFLRAASVGFKPTKYFYNEERRGVDVEESHLLEWSIVPVPANPECLVQLSLIPKGIVDSFAEGCESLLTACKGKGQWVVGVELDYDKIAAGIAKGLPKLSIESIEEKAMAGCEYKEKCPNAADGTPETCPKGKACPMLAANQQGGGKAGEEDVLTSIELEKQRTDDPNVLDIEDEADHILGIDTHDILKAIRETLIDGMKSQVRHQVAVQLSKAKGRLDYL